MIEIQKDARKMQYVITIDRDSFVYATLSQDNYNSLIATISRLIYEQMRKTT